MARHAAHRTPRAHWILLLLGGLVLLAELCFNGYVELSAGESGTPAPHVGSALTDPAGPVLRVDRAGGVTAAAVPAGAIALTFDDGPDPRWTPRILDALREHHARATFFVVGSQVNRHPELARRILAEGHELGVHTFTHPDLVSVPVWRQRLELTLTTNAIAAATGRTVRLMRPPYSSTPSALAPDEFAAVRAAADAGYLTVLTDLDTEDWRRPGVDAIVRAARPEPRATSGAVVMLHDGGGDRSQTVEATWRILAETRGFRFVTVSEGVGLPATDVAGTGAKARGLALRWTQTTAAWLSDAMWWLIVLSTALALLRLAVQVAAARRHARLARRLRHGRAYRGRVSVIVPAYNEAANIAATVRSLVANDYPGIEVVVVDDGSTDGTADIVRRLGLPSVRVIRQPNAGKPAALNTGIAAARGDLLVLVDGDTVFEPDAVGQLVQPFADPDVGAVSGNTKVANRRGLLGRWQHLEYVVGFNLDRRMFDLGGCMPTIPGAIGAFRREALFDVDGVPADTLAEDTDLTMAVLRAGWRVVYAPDAVAWTEAPGSLRQLWRQRYRWCYGTMQAAWKHRRAVLERGGGGRLGRRGLVYLVLFQMLLPLTAPLVDVYAVYGLAFLPWAQVAAVWCGFTALQVLAAAYALRLDREPMGPLWTVPLQQVVYRQLLYLVVVQSSVAALLGGRQRWQAMARTGLASAMTPTR
ncbi:glycosyltransferase [Dactylosporangium fulvum]|uniref:Bifunctional polysaccharide deacetylase/glycosyltransferase family 2 protein n=1 Tax=Dactylosporangium fulvum TaxID=53359 RepID=A0ABY5VZP2_9ACTN|nr:bifunctional polysaccharide deacetylase/glycosyltransferase family 2 protein [Dactylosporangium fulvum]UWP83273.1 bifunctional polysaccharide deacetylase/glycosyltransferase family 2 protein [Dactylosporangium fulvum]